MYRDAKKNHGFKVIATALIAAMLSAIPVQSGYAQVALPLPVPGVRLHPTGAFNPVQIVGLKVDRQDPFHFYFVMDKGDAALGDDRKKGEYRKLIKHFLAALTIPNKDVWVNLSPYEAQRIIGDNFAKTATGQELLGQDYVLKQFTASLMYPEEDVGRGFWQKVYAQAYDKLGTTDIPVDTFNKIWIRADAAEVYEKDGAAFLVKSHLKVMLESDYVAMSHQKDMAESSAPAGDVAMSHQKDMAESSAPAETREFTVNAVREIIIPIIEKEVNEGENFAPLRQIYTAMILATWFKKTLKESLLSQVYSDKNKVAGVEANDPKSKEKIYERYLEAFKVGVFNYIKDEADPLTHETAPRKYFSGGMAGVAPEIISDASQGAGNEFLSKPGREIVDTDLVRAIERTHADLVARREDLNHETVRAVEQLTAQVHSQGAEGRFDGVSYAARVSAVDNLIQMAQEFLEVSSGKKEVIFYIPEDAPADSLFVHYAARNSTEVIIVRSLDALQGALSYQTAIVFFPFSKSERFQEVSRMAGEKSPQTLLAFSDARLEPDPLISGNGSQNKNEAPKGVIVVSEEVLSDRLREHRDSRQVAPMHPKEAWHRLDALKKEYVAPGIAGVQKEAVQPPMEIALPDVVAVVSATAAVTTTLTASGRLENTDSIFVTAPDRVVLSSNGKNPSSGIPYPQDADRETAFKNYLARLQDASLDINKKVELAIAFLETQWLSGNEQARREYRGVNSVSGVSGMADVLRYLFLRNKDILNPNIVLIRSAYGGTDANLEFYRKYGLDVRYVTDPDKELVGVSDRSRPGVLDENTVAVIFESPNNPPLKVWDIEKIVRTVKANAPRALTIFDGAFATPAGQQPLKFGVDIVIQVVTKMLGTGNAFGTVAVAKKEIAADLEYVRSAQIHEDDARNIFEYGVSTFFERYRTSLDNTRNLVKWLKQQQDVVSSLSYPGDPDHPQFDITLRQAEGENYGNMIKFTIKDGLESAKLFIKILTFLRVPKHSVSLGEARTQVQLPLAGVASTMPEEAKQKLPSMGMNVADVRISVGIEDSKDIINDFDTALRLLRLFKGREGSFPLAELRKYLMHPVVQPDGMTVEHVGRLFPEVGEDEGSGEFLAEPKIEKAIGDLERAATSWPLGIKSVLNFGKSKKRLDDTLLSLRIIHEATRLDRYSPKTLAVISNVFWGPLSGNLYAVTPGAGRSNADVVQDADVLAEIFKAPLEAGKPSKERSSPVVKGLYGGYGRLGNPDARSAEYTVASIEAGVLPGGNQDVQGVSVPTFEAAFDILGESVAFQDESTRKSGPVRIAVIAQQGSAVDERARKFKNIYEGLFLLKGERRVEFSVITPDAEGRNFLERIHRDTDFVLVDEFLDKPDGKTRLFRAIRAKAGHSCLAVVNSRGFIEGFHPIKSKDADIVLDRFNNPYGKNVAAVIVAPREAWATKLFGRRTFTSIATRAPLLSALSVIYRGHSAPDSAELVNGGIDLRDEYLRIKVDGGGMPLPLQLQDPAMINIQGLEPVIRNIAPMTPINMPILSELTTASALSAG